LRLEIAAKMVNAGLRAPWVLALLVVFLTLPIVGITVYFMFELEQRVAFTRSEQVGLGQIETLRTLFIAASALANATHCAAHSSVNAGMALRRADAAAARVDNPAVRLAWSTARLGQFSSAALDRLFGTLTGEIIALSDSSGLTFDPESIGIDFSDSFTYRIPPAIDRLQSVQRGLCALSATLPASRWIALIKDQTRAEQSMYYNAQDLQDAMAHKGANVRLSILATALRRIETSNAVASANLETLVSAPASARRRKEAVRSYNAPIAALYDLWKTETPILRELLAARIVGYNRQRLLMLVPAVAGALVTVLVVLLAMRLAYQRAALDLAERAAAEHERAAMHDPLTGLLNRRAFLGVVKRAAEGPHRGAVCVFDVDDFKQINDRFGHPTGDELLTNIGRILEASVRSTDAVARLGGDEFAIFLRAPIDRAGIERVLKTITAEITAPMKIRGATVHSSASAGAALMEETNVSFEDALSVADAALYRAKSNARGGFLISGTDRR
jgi:diguanylate cyclase (GGDEF)-like protein